MEGPGKSEDDGAFGYLTYLTRPGQRTLSEKMQKKRCAHERGQGHGHAWLDTSCPSSRLRA